MDSSGAAAQQEAARQEQGRESPASSPEAVVTRGHPTGMDRLRRHTWWSTVGMIYVLGALFVGAVLITESSRAVAVVAAVVAASGFVATAYLVQSRLTVTSSASGEDSGDENGFPVVLGAVAVTMALAVTVLGQWASDGPAGAWFFLPGLVVGAIALSVTRPRRVRVVAGGALVSGAVAATARYSAGVNLDPTWLAVEIGLVAGVAGALVYSVWYWEVVDRLDRARRLEGKLAVTDERLRFAADLHDVQGHHLQVIALKSELATRLAESDPAAAGQHMREVHDQARAALSDTRAVVQGYRRASLGAELVNATRVLDAAGLDSRLARGTESTAETVSAQANHLLGLVVREATTNILRHSRAAAARFSLTAGERGIRLRITNDGAAEAAGDARGTGLAALAERVHAADGTLEWERDGDWFTLAAEVPLGSDHLPNHPSGRTA